MGESVHKGVRVGDEEPPVNKRVTQEQIDKWADLSGDHNPLHVDPEFAKSTRFGGTIAHGHLPIAFVSEMMTRWLRQGWILGGKVQLTFLVPVKPGDTIIAKGVVREKMVEAGRKVVLCDIFCENQEGTKVIVGEARGAVL